MKQAQKMKQIKAIQYKCWKLKVTKCTDLKRIWYIQTDNDNKERVIITKDCCLVYSKTGEQIAENTRLNVRYMLKFRVCDNEGNSVKVVSWDQFEKVINKSAAFELKRFRKSKDNLADVFASYLKILNSSSWLITFESQVFGDIITFNVLNMQKLQ